MLSQLKYTFFNWPAKKREKEKGVFGRKWHAHKSNFNDFSILPEANCNWRIMSREHIGVISDLKEPNV